MADKNIALIAHLMRRAGFGAQYDELETRAAKGYEATVEELLHPEDHPNGLDLDLAERSFIEWNQFTRGVPEYFAFRMINSKAQLSERMTGGHDMTTRGQVTTTGARAGMAGHQR